MVGPLFLYAGTGPMWVDAWSFNARRVCGPRHVEALTQVASGADAAVMLLALGIGTASAQLSAAEPP